MAWWLDVLKRPQLNLIQIPFFMSSLFSQCYECYGRHYMQFGGNERDTLIIEKRHGRSHWLSVMSLAKRFLQCSETFSFSFRADISLDLSICHSPGWNDYSARLWIISAKLINPRTTADTNTVGGQAANSATGAYAFLFAHFPFCLPFCFFVSCSLPCLKFDCPMTKFY